MTKHKPTCDVCGEHDHKTRTIVVKVDGKRHARWTLCRCCAAIKLQRIAVSHPKS